MNKGTRLVAAGFLSATLAGSTLLLGGCANDNDGAGSAEPTSASTAASAENKSAEHAAQARAAADALTIEQGVVRAGEEGSDMTAIFGTLKNSSDKDIEIAGFHTSVEADMNQIHETVDGQMSEMKQPLVVPAAGEVELAPGGKHFMLMGLHEPIKAGQTLDLTAELADGSEVDLGEIAVRAMGAGGESYGDLEEGHGDMHGDVHGDMHSGSHGDMHEHSH